MWKFGKGLFSRKKEKNKQEYDDSRYKWLRVGDALELSQSDKEVSEDNVVKMVDEILKQVKSVDEMQAETKLEYDAVIKHLSDLQRFENLDDRDKMEITDTARTILGIEEQRMAYQDGERRISRERYQVMETYCEELPKQMRVMEEREKYLILINNDLRQVEGEKGSIKYDREQNVSKRNFLIKFTYFCIVLLITVFILFFVLSAYTKKSFTLPFFITGAAACIYAAYFAITMRNCSMAVKRCDLLSNRANELGNKIKIKLVNTTNALDYTYEKYKCNSHQELQYIWQAYQKEKDDEKKYRRNTQLLGSYQNTLLQLLDRAGFEIPDIWIHQSETLLDRGELLDMRDVLDNRRRKLKAQLDFNIRQKDNLINEIEILCRKYEKYDGLIKRIVRESI